MRRFYLLVAIVMIVALGGLVGRSGSRSLARQEDAPAPRMLPPPAAASPEFQGAASCAAVACHHGNGPRGTRGSEYTTWIAQNDPHSRAYTVLFDRRSLLIEKNLKGLKTLEEARPHKNVVCLNCHVHPDAEHARHGERFSLADGVGCESCHGAAEGWLSRHYERGVLRDELYQLGMKNTKDVLVRAQVCVKCHVGWEESDVNHDLIAAGHPRLRFEYGAYLANYPAKHWRVEDDHARYPDFEARAWLAGQVLSARAALDLLEYRARTKDKPWPEFAEYGCFACHHDLQDQQWRQKRGAGQLAWGTWYYSQLPLVAGLLPSARPDDLRPFDELTRTMARNYPDEKQVRRQAARAAAVLDRWATGLRREAWDEKSLQQSLADLTRDAPQAGEPDWDRSAQRYLGIAAVYNALGDLDPRYRNDNELKSAVLRLASTLNRAFPKSQGVKFDSPRDFRPEFLQKDLGRLRQELRRRGME